jgi:murein DD-endopeptidase MepM/ murein hydrolase activator NlpD
LNFLKTFIYDLYVLFLYVGKTTIMIFIDLGNIARLLYKMIRKFLLPIIIPIKNRISNKLEEFFRPVTLIIKRIKLKRIQLINDYNRYTKNGFSVFLKILKDDFKSWKNHHPNALTTSIKLTTPIFFIIIFIFSINFMTGLTYAVGVSYDNKFIGYVEDEVVFNTAEKKVYERVVDENKKDLDVKIPKYSIAIVEKKRLFDENEIADKIVELSTDSVVQAKGLYIENEFFGALESTTEIQLVLENTLEKFKSPEENMRIDFAKKIEFKDALYPKSSIKQPEEIVEKLTSNEPSSQNLLQVKLSKKVEYEEPIPFETIKEVDNARVKGKSAVVQKGSIGKSKVVADVEYIDGVEIGRTVLQKVTIKEPVAKKVVEGTAEPVTTRVLQNAKPTNGKKIQFPAADGYISRFEYLSGGVVRAVDIAAPQGTPIYSVLDGVVILVKAHPSYGKYAVIQHADGYQSLYAHAHEIYVKEGERVTKGQHIMAMGRTGRATGNHLHFEFMFNGSHINPALYW